ncbi:TrmH family RNA methyltransferase [Bacillus sp. CGMCC 1.16607]|uniref:TrmH family RNA methyltransferase n=1 Tax=Bacillus sp. CGMCC 1.16607 TaxID=3351842 RepID=UPI00362BB9B1
MKYIHSSKNPQVKQWKKLHTKKERENTGTFLVEGFHLVEEALKVENLVLELIVSEEVEIPARINYGSTPMTQINKEIVKELAETETSQGIFAVCNQPNQEVIDGRTYLLLDSIQDPGNLGTIIRTADAAGIDAIIVGNGSVDIYNSKVLRSAQGSHFHLPIIRGDLFEWIEKLKKADIPLYGTALENGTVYTEVKPTSTFALIVGNEGNGIQAEILKATNQNLYIPIFGKSESLNVSVAAGILLYYFKNI